MKITVNNLKKLVKKLVRPDENSGKEKDTFEAALKRARDEAKYNLTEELREKTAGLVTRNRQVVSSGNWLRRSFSNRRASLSRSMRMIQIGRAHV